MAVMVHSGAWGKLIHEKNQMSKISWHCPFNSYHARVSLAYLYKSFGLCGRGRVLAGHEDQFLDTLCKKGQNQHRAKILSPLMGAKASMQ